MLNFMVAGFKRGMLDGNKKSKTTKTNAWLVYNQGFSHGRNNMVPGHIRHVFSRVYKAYLNYI